MVYNDIILENDESSIDSISENDFVKIIDIRNNPDNSYFNTLQSIQKNKINFSFIFDNGKKQNLPLPEDIKISEILKAFYLKNGMENHYLITEKYNIINYNNKKLKIKLKGINNVTNMSFMFYGCSSLLSLPDISKWNTNNVINMIEMFYGCSSLSSFPNISNWNTDKVTNMNNMLEQCSSLSSYFDFSKMYITKSLTFLDDISKIKIKNIKGETILIINCLISETTKSIKNRIKDKEGIPSELQLLYFNKKQLEDNKTLKDYKIKNMSTLHLVLKKEENNNK